MINDNELDILFEQSAQRQKAVEEINRQVMQTVRRDMRLKVVKKWMCLLTISFGLPVLLVLYIYMLYTYMPDIPQWIMYICYAMPLGTLAAFLGKTLHDFSPTNM